MLENCAVPYLKRLADSEIRSHNIHVIGMTESAVEDKLRDMMLALENPTLAPYAKDGEVLLRVTAKAASKDEADDLMRPVIKDVLDILGDVVYGIDKKSLEATVLEFLAEKGKTLATAESCTGGLTAKRITDAAGASRSYATALLSKEIPSAVWFWLLVFNGFIRQKISADNAAIIIEAVITISLLLNSNGFLMKLSS